MDTSVESVTVIVTAKVDEGIHWVDSYSRYVHIGFNNNAGGIKKIERHGDWDVSGTDVHFTPDSI